MAAWAIAVVAIIAAVLAVRGYRRTGVWALRVLLSTAVAVAIVVFTCSVAAAALPEEIVAVLHREFSRAGWKGAVALAVAMVLATLFMMSFVHAGSGEDDRSK